MAVKTEPGLQTRVAKSTAISGAPKNQSSVWRGHTEDFSLILFHQLIENDNSGDYLKQQISAEAK